MRNIVKLVVALFMTLSAVQADELTTAYQKEFAFLKAQKQELQNRLSREKIQQKRDLSTVKSKVNQLQNSLLGYTTQVQDAQINLGKLHEDLADVEDNSAITQNVVMQARATLAPYNIVVGKSSSASDTQKLQEAFLQASDLYHTLSSIRKVQGDFFLPDGSKAKGEIVKVGNIASYGVAKEASGALAPAGEGVMKLWKMPGSENTAKMLAVSKVPESIAIFAYENSDKEVADPKEKTLMDTINAGGIIGWVIIVLGVIGLLLVILRFFFLSRSGSNVNRISGIVVQKIEDCDASSALPALKDYSGATARVIKATLRNIKRDRDHLEDIITESILNESSSLDRFGNFILVIAAVAPLLGLLGTVSGMISTFDVITEFGTGDPKLLAGGISEALVTTMMGLIVAIPLLLIGNLLAGWAQNIKDSMEQSALHIVNLYEKNKEKCSKQ